MATGTEDVERRDSNSHLSGRSSRLVSVQIDDEDQHTHSQHEIGRGEGKHREASSDKHSSSLCEKLLFWWHPENVSWWTAVTFTLGSIAWVVNGVVVFFDVISDKDKALLANTTSAFIGGTFFLMGGAFIYWEGLNQKHPENFGEEAKRAMLSCCGLRKQRSLYAGDYGYTGDGKTGARRGRRRGNERSKNWTKDSAPSTPASPDALDSGTAPGSTARGVVDGIPFTAIDSSKAEHNYNAKSRGGAERAWEGGEQSASGRHSLSHQANKSFQSSPSAITLSTANAVASSNSYNSVTPKETAIPPVHQPNGDVIASKRPGANNTSSTPIAVKAGARSTSSYSNNSDIEEGPHRIAKKKTGVVVTEEKWKWFGMTPVVKDKFEEVHRQDQQQQKLKKSRRATEATAPLSSSESLNSIHSRDSALSIIESGREETPSRNKNDPRPKSKARHIASCTTSEDLYFWGGFFQLIAVIIFWISVLCAFVPFHILPEDEADDPTAYSWAFWTPQIVGASFLIISSLYLTLKDQRKWYLPEIYDMNWHIGFWNIWGSVGFWLSALFGYYHVTLDSPKGHWGVAFSTFWGSISFLLGSLLQLHESIRTSRIKKKEKQERRRRMYNSGNYTPY